MHYSDTIGSGWVPALLIPNKEPSWISSPAGASGYYPNRWWEDGSGRRQEVSGGLDLPLQNCRPPKVKGNPLRSYTQHPRAPYIR